MKEEILCNFVGSKKDEVEQVFNTAKTIKEFEERINMLFNYKFETYFYDDRQFENSIEIKNEIFEFSIFQGFEYDDDKAEQEVEASKHIITIEMDSNYLEAIRYLELDTQNLVPFYPKTIKEMKEDIWILELNFNLNDEACNVLFYFTRLDDNTVIFDSYYCDVMDK